MEKIVLQKNSQDFGYALSTIKKNNFKLFGNNITRGEIFDFINTNYRDEYYRKFTDRRMAQFQMLIESEITTHFESLTSTILFFLCLRKKAGIGAKTNNNYASEKTDKLKITLKKLQNETNKAISQVYENGILDYYPNTKTMLKYIEKLFVKVNNDYSFLGHLNRAIDQSCIDAIEHLKWAPVGFNNDQEILTKIEEILNLIVKRKPDLKIYNNIKNFNTFVLKYENDPIDFFEHDMVFDHKIKKKTTSVKKEKRKHEEAILKKRFKD